MHEFETFRRPRTAGSADPMVTIQRRGTISLNAAAYRAMGHPAAVELLYNADERIIGLRPADPHLSHSHLVRTSAGGGAPYLISAGAFTRYYDIDTSTALRWVGYLDDGILCVDLRTESTAPTGRRNGAAADVIDRVDGSGPLR